MDLATPACRDVWLSLPTPATATTSLRISADARKFTIAGRHTAHALGALVSSAIVSAGPDGVRIPFPSRLNRRSWWPKKAAAQRSAAVWMAYSSLTITCYCVGASPSGDEVRPPTVMELPSSRRPRPCSEPPCSDLLRTAGVQPRGQRLDSRGRRSPRPARALKASEQAPSATAMPTSQGSIVVSLTRADGPTQAGPRCRRAPTLATSPCLSCTGRTRSRTLRGGSDPQPSSGMAMSRADDPAFLLVVVVPPECLRSGAHPTSARSHSLSRCLICGARRT